jgi:hypothetical protein
MNVLIFPTDDRSGQASLIFHYQKLGHRVFIPAHGTFGLNWKRVATWPALLCKTPQDPTKRNLDIHGFERSEENLFGEDFFLASSFAQDASFYDDDVACELIDESFDGTIDAYHTLRGGEAYLYLYRDIIAKKFPSAKWISSTFNQMTSMPQGFKPANCAKLIPAPYENHHLDVNNVSLMSVDFEQRLLSMNDKFGQAVPNVDFASFNHNFAQRQPDDFRLFMKMNQLFVDMGGSEVPNFGGNIRTQGADVRFSGDQGITGKFSTLTPRQAYLLTAKRVRAVVHFKSDDWGGGVFYYSLNAGTPIVTTQRYVNASNSGEYLKNDVNCCIINTPEEAAQALYKLKTNDLYRDSLAYGMKQMRESIFNESYWTRWETFLENLV